MNRPNILPPSWQALAAILARGAIQGHSDRLRFQDPDSMEGTEESRRRFVALYARNDGSEAFEALARIYGLKDSARIAAALNLLSLTHDERRALVEFLHAAALSPGGSERRRLDDFRNSATAGNILALSAEVRESIAIGDF